MRRSLTVAVGAAAACAALVLASSPAAAAGVRAHWALDEVGSPAVAIDDSGNGNDGVNRQIASTGEGYLFNGVDSAVTVPNSASLNPGSDPFTFGATLTTTLPPAHGDYDILRKGLSTSAGGEYKIEIININGIAKALCLAKDSNRHVASIRWAPPGGLADGRVHTIACSKTSTGVTLQVDAFPARTKVNSAGIGTIGNTTSLFLGTKEASGGDVFSGILYDAYVA